jgi:hypothetical protein
MVFGMFHGALAATKGSDSPKAPAKLMATPLNKSIDLSWEAASEREQVKEYRIYLNGKLVQTVKGTLATIAGLDNGQEYKIAVSAVDVNGKESMKTFVLASPRNILPTLLIIFICITYIYNKVFRAEKLTIRQSVRKHLQAVRNREWSISGRSLLIYSLILIGSYMLLFFQEMGLPIIPSLLIAIGLMLIVRIRYWIQERNQKAGNPS